MASSYLKVNLTIMRSNSSLPPFDVEAEDKEDLAANNRLPTFYVVNAIYEICKVLIVYIHLVHHYIEFVRTTITNFKPIYIQSNTKFK